MGRGTLRSQVAISHCLVFRAGESWKYRWTDERTDKQCDKISQKSSETQSYFETSGLRESQFWGVKKSRDYMYCFLSLCEAVKTRFQKNIKFFTENQKMKTNSRCQLKIHGAICKREIFICNCI